MIGVYYRPTGKIRDNSILLWNYKILLDVVNDIGVGGCLALYIGHISDKLATSRLSEGEIQPDINDHVVASAYCDKADGVAKPPSK